MKKPKRLKRIPTLKVKKSVDDSKRLKAKKRI